MAEELIEPFATTEIYVDGFTGHHLINGNIACVGFRMLPCRETGKIEKIVVLRLVFPASAVPSAVEEAQTATKPTHSIDISDKPKRLN